MDGDDEDKALIWKLPVIKSKDLGKLGPAFGYGVGCGFGLGVGLLGGVGLGPGIPGLQIGFGVGAGCGAGVGFGYGVGRGVAYDENRRYTNVGKLSRGVGTLPSQDHIVDVIDELVVNTKKLIEVTSREIDKWRSVLGRSGGQNLKACQEFLHGLVSMKNAADQTCSE